MGICGCNEVSGCEHLQDLSGSTHINIITTSANRTLCFVKRNILTKIKDIKPMSYNSLVRPHVEYASTVRSPYRKEIRNKIEKVQRRTVRRVSNDYSNITDMLSNLRWRSLDNRRIDARLTMFYKAVYGLVRHILCALKYTLVTCTLSHTNKFTHQSVIAIVHFPHAGYSL